MITRFFSTSKPIHLVIVSSIALAITVGVYYSNFIAKDIKSGWPNLLMASTLVMASISILAFFVSKNSLTGKNGYKILFFVLLLAILPQSITEVKVILSNFFVLLAMRRVFSLRNNQRLKKKLFDAGFWIALATLCYFGAVLFYAWIFVALVLYSIDQPKNWVIPLISTVSVAVLYMSFFIITTGTYGDFGSQLEAPSADFTSYNSLQMIIGITIMISLGIWATVNYILRLKDKPKLFRASHLLVIYAALISVIIIIISPVKNGSEFLFLFAPLAIIMTNFLERLNDKWFAEVFVWLLVVTPLVLLVL